MTNEMLLLMQSSKFLMFYVFLLFRTLTFMKKRMSRTNEARKTFKVFDKQITF